MEIRVIRGQYLPTLVLVAAMACWDDQIPEVKGNWDVGITLDMVELAGKSGSTKNRECTLMDANENRKYIRVYLRPFAFKNTAVQRHGQNSESWL